MDTCDECGKRIADGLQICITCFRKYKENREKLVKEAREACALALGIKEKSKNEVD